MRLIIIIIFTVILLYPFSALYSLHVIPDSNQQNRNSVSFSLETGLMNGNIGEYVYSGDNKISELKWDIKPLIYVGNVIKAKFKNNISAGLGYWFNVNSRAGNISDTDRGSAGEIIKYSDHESVIVTARFFDVFAGYDFILSDRLRLTPLAGYNYKQFILEARNGYSEDVSTGTHYYSSGVFIQYDQKYQIPYAGIAVLYGFIPDLSVTLSGTFSNMLFCRAEDNHVSGVQVFYDNFEWGRYYSVAAAVEWFLGDRLSLAASFGYYAVRELRGDTYSMNKNTGSKSMIYKNGAGISFKSADLRVGFKYIFQFI